MGSRFWVSTYYNAEDESRNYTFCYDTEKEEYWQVKEGLKDNFYQTGNVRRMDPIDPYCHSYCFSKSERICEILSRTGPRGKPRVIYREIERVNPVNISIESRLMGTK